MPCEPLAMFPLAAVVFPTTELPLHVFEQRYQTLTRDVLLGDREFGICLISRGSEVGGGDERVMVGTRVRVEHAAPLAEDRWLLVTRGIERVRVVEWLDDDPYPRAHVEPMSVDGPNVSHQAVVSTLAAVTALRRLHAEFADAWTGPCVDLKLECASSSAPWMLCAMSPLTLSDLQRLLEIPSHVDRLSALRELCDEQRHDLEAVLRLDASS